MYSYSYIHCHKKHTATNAYTIKAITIHNMTKSKSIVQLKLAEFYWSLRAGRSRHSTSIGIDICVLNNGYGQPVLNFLWHEHAAMAEFNSKYCAHLIILGWKYNVPLSLFVWISWISASI